MFELVFWISAFSFVAILYLFPTVVALINRHPGWAGIFILNLFLGFTVLGWIIPLAWAVTLPRSPVVIDQRRR